MFMRVLRYCLAFVCATIAAFAFAIVIGRLIAVVGGDQHAAWRTTLEFATVAVAMTVLGRLLARDHADPVAVPPPPRPPAS